MSLEPTQDEAAAPPPARPAAATAPRTRGVSAAGIVAIVLGAMGLICLQAPGWLGCLIYVMLALGSLLAVAGLITAAISLVFAITHGRSGRLLPALALLLCLLAVACAAYRILPFVAMLAAEAGGGTGP